MAKVKDIAKELVGTQVGDNGEVKDFSLKSELESLINQYNSSIQKRDQHTSAAKQEDSMALKCLGAIEVVEKMLQQEGTGQEDA